MENAVIFWIICLVVYLPQLQIFNSYVYHVYSIWKSLYRRTKNICYDTFLFLQQLLGNIFRRTAQKIINRKIIELIFLSQFFELLTNVKNRQIVPINLVDLLVSSINDLRYPHKTTVCDSGGHLMLYLGPNHFPG